MPATQAIRLNDYSLVGNNTVLAIQRGLAEATWYTSPVPKEKMRELLGRKDGPAIRDTVLWFALIFVSGYAGYRLWQAGSWWAVIPFMIYGVLYASTSDSRWHEAGHGTAFKTDWMNNALYELASFMVLRESVIWRWSHARHHSDTIIVGRDPEIVAPRPPNIIALTLNFMGMKAIPGYFQHIMVHSLGKLTDEEKTFVPKSEYAGVVARARIYVLVYASVIALAIYNRSLLPLMFIGLPTFYGSWLMPIYGYTQHAGLAENVLDHRLNCRTVYVNFIHRFLYWNMNYHTEHHMFPLVPYHNLPQLHELVKADMPAPYPSLWAAWRELVPAVMRQVKEPTYFVERKLPTPTIQPDFSCHSRVFAAKGHAVQGWLEICASGFLNKEDVIRFDHEGRTYAVYRTDNGQLFASDGLCTHGNAHLADGLVKGKLIECPKHNGRFDVTDGSPQRKPVCVAIKTYPAQELDGKIFIKVSSPKDCTGARAGESRTTPAI
jgi:Na+-transporting NADH:ubiquinone oxidoreductase subunit F